ncbi:MAG: hypothetical protein ACRDJN_28290, partial [Chloroflexota bacterium]
MVAETAQTVQAVRTTRPSDPPLASHPRTWPHGALQGPDGAAGRQWFGRTGELLAMPPLIEVQLRSFAWFQREGLREL